MFSPLTGVIRRFDVVNRGLSGYNTSNALKALPDIIPPPVPGGPKMAYLVRLLCCRLSIRPAAAPPPPPSPSSALLTPNSTRLLPFYSPR